MSHWDTKTRKKSDPVPRLSNKTFTVAVPVVRYEELRLLMNRALAKSQLEHNNEHLRSHEMLFLLLERYVN